MGLFKKKKETYQFSTYNQSNQAKVTSFDRLKVVTITNNKDETLFDLCDLVLDGFPVLANFDKIETQDANKMLSFISGVVYATDGKIIKFQPKLFLMGIKEVFEDGSLYQYYEDSTK